MNKDQCQHINRVGPLFPGHRMGGASIGQCENPVIPGFVVCFDHVTKDALAMRLHQVERENEKLRKGKKKNELR